MVGSYYRKAKPETQLKNRDEYKKLYSTEIKWLKDNLNLLKDDKFMIDMYTILITFKVAGIIQSVIIDPINTFL